jgi:hypothetical protein
VIKSINILYSWSVWGMRGRMNAYITITGKLNRKTSWKTVVNGRIILKLNVKNTRNWNCVCRFICS